MQFNIFLSVTDHTVLIATESGKSAFRRIRSINKVSNSISSNNEMLEQSKVMMSDHVSWEDFLVPVPMTIAFLGQLMLISTLKDFPIDKHKPKHGFRYLKHPKSFRASVVQVDLILAYPFLSYTVIYFQIQIKITVLTSLTTIC